jgi:predicted nuclease of predicted toxin-antitoxin system
VIFVLDQQLPATPADWFVERGFEATHVRDLGMRTAPDTEVWRYAVAHDATVVTKDKDLRGPRVLWLRLGNATNRVLRSHLDRVWSDVLKWLATDEPIVEA